MRVLNSKVLYVGICLFLAIIPLAAIVDSMVMYMVVGSVLITTSIAVVHAYYGAAWIALGVRISDLRPVDILSLAFVTLFLTIAMREGYITIWRTIFPVPSSRSAEYFIPLIFFRYFVLVSAVLALHSRPAMLGPRFMQKVPGWPRVILAIISGLTLATVLLLY